MKNLLLFTLLSFFDISTFSQSSIDSLEKKPNTNLERLNLQIGTIIKKEYIDLYNYKAKGFLNTDNFSVKILKIIDAATGTETSGLYISTVDVGDRYSSVQSYSGYIDADEVDGLVKFLDFLIQNNTQVEDKYTEYIFNCRDLQFYGYYSQNYNNKNWSWKYGLRVDKYYDRSAISLNIETIQDFNNSLKEKLEDIKK